jgi:anti-anti-sigma factor
MNLNTSFVEKFNSNNITGTTMAVALTPGTPNQIYFSINGNIETLNAHHFGEAVIETVRNTESIKTIIFDFKAVNYLSSSGVGSIIHILTIPETRSIEIFFLNVNEKIQSVFRVLGFANILKILKEDAYASKFPISKNCPKCKTEVRITSRTAFPCPKCGVDLLCTDNDELMVQSSSGRLFLTLLLSIP